MKNLYSALILITVTVGLISSCAKKEDDSTSNAVACSSGCTAIAGSTTAAGSITVGNETLSGTYVTSCYIGSSISTLI